MPEHGGLQIEVRCVRCGKLPTADITLFEMRNHLYLCNICREKEEQRGKHFTWVNGLQSDTPRTVVLPSTPTTSLAAPTGPIGRPTTISLQGNLPPDSIFGGLGLSLDTPSAKIAETIKQEMAIWRKKPASTEQKQMLARLRQWAEELKDEQSFEERREALKSLSRTGKTLSVGGRLVWSAQEFLDACEESQAGWSDGERYLRNGKLWQWILYTLEDRDLAMRVRHYQGWTNVSDFRALNEALYCLVSTRPFRLYSNEKWQQRDAIPSAKTPEELAQLCDTYWEVAEQHLYAGSMVFWLEHLHGLAALSEYYQKCIVGYATQGADRGVGLELLLEHAVPSLKKPQLVVTFDDQEGSYKTESRWDHEIPHKLVDIPVSRWDHEIPHKPVNVTIANQTRGFTSLNVVLQPPANSLEPSWLVLNGRTLVHGRPGAGMPASFTLTMQNLKLLQRGRTYKRTLTIARLGEYGSTPGVENYPITLKTMWFFQGLRGILWQSGLRGNIPALLWNFLAGTLLALLPFLLIPALVPASYSFWYISLGSANLLGVILQAVAAGFVQLLMFSHPLLSFPFMAGSLMGFTAFWIGLGKGHMDYTAKNHSSNFRKTMFWLAFVFTLTLMYFTGWLSAIGAALQNFNDFAINGQYMSYEGVACLQAIGGGLLFLLFVFLLACILAAIETRVERFLRQHYKSLLEPVGRGE